MRHNIFAISCLLLFCGLLQGCDNAKDSISSVVKTEPPKIIEIGDVERFGNTLLNKSICLKGYVYQAYPCTQNLGFQCLVLMVPGKDKASEAVLVKDGLYDLDFYKKILITKDRVYRAQNEGEIPMVGVTGKIKRIEANDDGKMVTLPTIIADKLEIIESK